MSQVQNQQDHPSAKCLNCGHELEGHYCSQCGQKDHPTRQPLKVFLADAFETLLNIDSRWFRSLKVLFLNPGILTREYLEGKRIKYLAPFRLYLSISIIYFLVVQFVDTNQVFFVNLEADESHLTNFIPVVQYSLFLLVPIMALFLMLIYKSKTSYFVEALVLALHIHTVWFVLLVVELFSVWLLQTFSETYPDVIVPLSMLLSVPAQGLTVVYLALYLKQMYQETWLKTIGKSFLLLVLYFSVLIGVVAAYIFFATRTI